MIDGAGKSIMKSISCCKTPVSMTGLTFIFRKWLAAVDLLPKTIHFQPAEQHPSLFGKTFYTSPKY